MSANNDGGTPLNKTAARIKELRITHHLSQNELAQKLGVRRETVAQWERGKNAPSRRLKELSLLFNVSTDYLLGESDTANAADIPDTSTLPPLTAKDERDIARDLERMIESLDGAAAMGDAEDDEDRELLKASLETAMKIAKRTAKKKFTPKKYRK